MRISDWSSDVCPSDLTGIWSRWRSAFMQPDALPATPAPACLRPDNPARRPPAGHGQAGSAAREMPPAARPHNARRSEEHTSELQSLMRISYAVFCLKKKKKKNKQTTTTIRIQATRY